MNAKLNSSHKVIKQLLNTSLARLGQPALARLRDARTQAMVRYAAHHGARQVAPAFSWAGNIAWHAVSTQYKPQLLAATVLVVAMLFGAAAYWQQPAESDTTAVDISILTDDLPMHIYLD